MATPTDAEILEEIQKAKHTIIQAIARGESAASVYIGGQRVEEHDPSKLLDTLDRMESIYKSRTTTRFPVQAQPY